MIQSLVETRKACLTNVGRAFLILKNQKCAEISSMFTFLSLLSRIQQSGVLFSKQSKYKVLSLFEENVNADDFINYFYISLNNDFPLINQVIRDLQ